jgi:hypothetical protein
LVEKFEVKVMWTEEDDSPGWISECAALGLYMCDESLTKLVQENRLAAETLRELDGKSLDFALDFKVETPDLSALAA